MLSTDLNIELIYAVELGRAAEVKRLLEAGANPHSRKKVTLTAKIRGGRKGDSVTESETVECESALALSIINGYPHVAQVLLQGGANPNAEICWVTGDFDMDKKRTREDWNTKRWMWTYTFPSALYLAFARGKVRKFDGFEMDVPNSEGKLGINKLGGHVQIVSPTVPEDVRVWCELRPSLQVVKVLLAYGAEVTEAILKFAEVVPDPRFMRLISDHVSRPQTDEPSSPPSYEHSQLTVESAAGP
ncbi:hypothetical protein HDU93_009779, partial [Gonapodya sp. JEL0774]